MNGRHGLEERSLDFFDGEENNDQNGEPEASETYLAAFQHSENAAPGTDGAGSDNHVMQISRASA